MIEINLLKCLIYINVFMCGLLTYLCYLNSSLLAIIIVFMLIVLGEYMEGIGIKAEKEYYENENK